MCALRPKVHVLRSAGTKAALGWALRLDELLFLSMTTKLQERKKNREERKTRKSLNNQKRSTNVHGKHEYKGSLENRALALYALHGFQQVYTGVQIEGAQLHIYHHQGQFPLGF